MSKTAIRVIITGTTGMVGEGVLHECLQNPLVDEVLIINRKPLGVTHPKLREIIHTDFYNLSAIERELAGFDACFFCLGVSSVGMNEPAYTKVTYTLTMHVAETLSRLNADMIFCYVSGAGTDSTEKGRSMWARVKGKTENDLRRLPFKKAHAFRPGFIKPTEGLTRTHRFYKYINWMYPIGRAIYPNGFCTLRELGLSMIHVVSRGCDKDIITGKDIIQLAKV
ncbi:NAD-dependent epimerase/dehydratase family protein [Chitinophaga agrisoli]|uniref:NAD-dependent epimerase/dehydratase family protein n=1 Tax=Chitinophaga agrisoli TaxID=2607653 RepID=A0A5B2VPZ6_9BACT|nr:NAD-dependent epimerase/dehydratase family protein [Chitinophaga agrisoli]KAA2240372.1 NAD-dependent epimerase/dehydratase family protein [Chitinophaga agrisoli]